MNNNIPKVSVCVVTYNHEKYIKECLESIVTQECNFDFEVIVGDDCSTDNTRAIVQEYANKYPNIVKPIFHEKNLGPQGNYLYIHNLAKGEYIAGIDGDDYVLAGKLQAQADFMDKTPDCNICFHRVKVLYQNGDMKDSFLEPDRLKLGFTQNDLLMIGTVAVNSSKMYRKGTLQILNKYNNFNNMMDFFSNIVQVEDKKAMFVDSNMYGVYRANVGIMMNPKIVDIKLSNLNLLNELFPNKKEYLNTVVFTYLLADFKNLRKSTFKYFLFWLKTFHYKSILNFIKFYPSLKYYRLP